MACPPESIVVREAGGVGDLVRLFAVIGALAERGPVRWYVPEAHRALCTLCPAVAAGGCTLASPDPGKLRRRSPLGAPARTWGELEGRSGYRVGLYPADTPVTDLYCPALAHEVQTAGAVTMDRLECWARAAGVWPLARGRVRVSLPAAATAAARDWFAEQGLDPARTVAVAPTSVSPIRTYRPGAGPEGRVGRAGNLIFRLRQRGYKVLVLDHAGGSAQLPATVVCADPDVVAQTARLGLCRAMVGVDSGFLHLACALGLPVVGLFGPTSGRWVLEPYLNPRRVLQGRWTGRARTQIGCERPCYRLPAAGYHPQLCAGRCEVLESLAEERIVEELDDIVRGRPGKLTVTR